MLYRRYAAGLLSMAARLLGNRGDAEEVVQDTFVTAFEQLTTLREPAAVRGWLGQIAVSLVRRRFRRLRLTRLLGLDRGADDATLEALADAGSAPADQRAELALVDRLLRRMRATVRIAWMLRRVEGLGSPRWRRSATAPWPPPSGGSARQTSSSAGTEGRRAAGGVMSRLRYPLKDGLADPASEEALARVWRGIDARAPRPPRRGRAGMWA